MIRRQLPAFAAFLVAVATFGAVCVMITPN